MKSYLLKLLILELGLIYLISQIGLKDFRFWQEKTQQIENNLSDRLHESLTNRFVDFSASFFVNSKNSGEEAIIEVDKERTIKLNGQNYGYINGFDLELNVHQIQSHYFL